MRALGACLLACFFVFPPLPAILSSAFGTAISWNPDYCATPLMTSALVRERLGVLASWLEVASWPMAAFQPVAGALPAPLPGTTAVRGCAGAPTCMTQQQRPARLTTRRPPCPSTLPQRTRMRCAWPPLPGGTPLSA